MQRREHAHLRQKPHPQTHVQFSVLDGSGSPLTPKRRELHKDGFLGGVDHQHPVGSCSHKHQRDNAVIAFETIKKTPSRWKKRRWPGIQSSVEILAGMLTPHTGVLQVDSQIWLPTSGTVRQQMTAQDLGSLSPPLATLTEWLLSGLCGHLGRELVDGQSLFLRLSLSASQEKNSIKKKGRQVVQREYIFIFHVCTMYVCVTVRIFREPII